SNVKKLAAGIPNQKNLQLLSITVDPERDQPKVLRRFRAMNGIQKKNWTFLTGNRTQIESLARDQFAGEVKTREVGGNLRDFVHTENLFLLDKQGYLRGVYRARGMGDLDRLIKDLKTIRQADQKSA